MKKVAKTARKPGRPRKETGDSTHAGCVVAPTDPNAICELIYNNPDTTKKMIKIFSQFNASTIDIKFRKTNVYFVAHSHDSTCLICIVVNCSEVTSYYYSSDVDICISCSAFNKVSTPLQKNDQQIMFHVYEDKAKLIVTIRDIPLEKNSSYPITTMGIVIPEFTVAAETDVLLSFVLPAATVKSTINEISSILTATKNYEFRVEKQHQGCLQFVIPNNNDWNVVWGNSARINLVDNQEEDGILAVTVNGNNWDDYAKALSNLPIGIVVNTSNKVYLWSVLDKRGATNIIESYVYCK